MPISDITEGVDMVLLTHNHIDHYEPSVKQHLPKDIPFYTQPQDKAAILKDGFSNVETIEESITLGHLPSPCYWPSRFRSDRPDDGTCFGLCADVRRASDYLYHGRLQWEECTLATVESIVLIILW